MRDDIIFHLVSSKDWKSFQSAGRYEPPSLEEEGFIHCSNGQQVQEIANSYFKGEKDLLLIVIDLASLESEIKFELPEDSDQKFPHVYGPINIDSIIDKIKLEPEDDGKFFIQFSTHE